MLLLLSIILKWPFFLSPPKLVENEADGLIYRYLFETLKKPNSYLLVCITTGIILIQALLLNKLVQDQRLLPRPTFLTAMAYIMITSLIPGWNILSSALIYNTVLILIIFLILNIYHKNARLPSFFNLGLLLGVSILLYVPSILIIFWVLIALFVLRPFRLREILIYLVGICTPLYFLLISTFVFTSVPLNSLIPAFSLSFPEKSPGNWLAGSIFFVILIAVLGLYYMQENRRRMLVAVRKAWSLIVLLLLFTLLIPFIQPANGYLNFVVVAVPLSILHAAAYYYLPVNWITRVLFWGFLLILILPALIKLY